MKKIFIGSIVPSALICKTEKISFASINYQQKVLKATVFDEKYNILPLNINKTSKSYFSEDGLKYVHNKYFNSRILKLLLDQLLLFIKINNKSVVVFYNVTIQNFLLIRYLSFFKHCSCYSIVADFEDIRNYSGIKKIIHLIINSSFKSLKGAIILNSNIKIPTKTFVLEGIVDLNREPIKYEKIKPNQILFSGSLGYTTGLQIAIEAMNYLPEFILVITGPLFDMTKQNIEELMDRSKHKNIEYMGIIDNENYLEILSSSNFALSLRNPAKLEHQHNFPSKIIEYLSYNKKVISTIDYPVVTKFLIKTDFDAEKLALAIRQNAHTKNKNSRHYIIDKFGLDNFNTTIEKLIKVIK